MVPERGPGRPRRGEAGKGRRARGGPAGPVPSRREGDGGAPRPGSGGEAPDEAHPGPADGPSPGTGLSRGGGGWGVAFGGLRRETSERLYRVLWGSP